MSGFTNFNADGNDAKSTPLILPSVESDNDVSSAPPSRSLNCRSSTSATMNAMDFGDPNKGSVLYERSDITRASEYANNSIFNGPPSSYRNDSNGRRSGAPSPQASPARKQLRFPPFNPSTFRPNQSAASLEPLGPRRPQTIGRSVQRSPVTVSQSISGPLNPGESPTSPLAPTLAPRCIEKCGPPFEPTKCWAPEPHSYRREKVSIMSISFQNEYSRHSPEELRANYYEVGGKDLESTWVPVKTQSINPFSFAANTASNFIKIGLRKPDAAVNTMPASVFGEVIGGMDFAKRAGFGESLQENNLVFGVTSKSVDTKAPAVQMDFAAGVEAGRDRALFDIKNYDVSSFRDVREASKDPADSSIVVALKEKLNELLEDVRGHFITDGLTKADVSKKEFTESEFKELMATHPLFLEKVAKEVDGRVRVEKHAIERALLKRLAKANPIKTVLEASKEVGVNLEDFTDDYDGDREDNGVI